jgi:23S rRNA (adenine2503-C2)-methyltransferase
MRIDDLRQRLRTAGAGPSHERRILRLWAQALPMDSGKRRIEDFLPASLRHELPAIEAELAAIARIQSVHPGADGSERLLVDSPTARPSKACCCRATACASPRRSAARSAASSA